MCGLPPRSTTVENWICLLEGAEAGEHIRDGQGSAGRVCAVLAAPQEGCVSRCVGVRRGSLYWCGEEVSTLTRFAVLNCEAPTVDASSALVSSFWESSLLSCQEVGRRTVPSSGCEEHRQL